VKRQCNRENRQTGECKFIGGKNDGRWRGEATKGSRPGGGGARGREASPSVQHRRQEHTVKRIPGRKEQKATNAKKVISGGGVRLRLVGRKRNRNDRNKRSERRKKKGKERVVDLGIRRRRGSVMRVIQREAMRERFYGTPR